MAGLPGNGVCHSASPSANIPCPCLWETKVGWVLLPQNCTTVSPPSLPPLIRFKSAQVTDKRVRVMNEVITGIRVIKMYAWEYAFRRVVTKLRK